MPGVLVELTTKLVEASFCGDVGCGCCLNSTIISPLVDDDDCAFSSLDDFCSSTMGWDDLISALLASLIGGPGAGSLIGFGPAGTLLLTCSTDGWSLVDDTSVTTASALSTASGVCGDNGGVIDAEDGGGGAGPFSFFITYKYFAYKLYLCFK